MSGQAVRWLLLSCLPLLGLLALALVALLVEGWAKAGVAGVVLGLVVAVPTVFAIVLFGHEAWKSSYEE